MTPASGADDADLHGVPEPLVGLLSDICGAVGLGTLDGGIPTVEGTVERGGRQWMCQASAYGDGNILVVVSVWPDRVPPDRRAAVEALISRVNWAMLAGDAEMDHRDGTVRWRTDLCLLGEPLSMRLAEGLVLPNLGTAQLLFERLGAVVAGEVEPERAAADMADAADAGAIALHR